MKKSVLKIACTLLLVGLLVSLCGCIKTDVARAHTNKFMDALVAEDYETAEALMHPEYKEDLAEFARKLRDEFGIDFKDGVTVINYTGMSSRISLTGSFYAHSFNALIGETKVVIEATLMDSDAGFGIIYFHISGESSNIPDTEPSHGEI